MKFLRKVIINTNKNYFKTIYQDFFIKNIQLKSQKQKSKSLSIEIVAHNLPNYFIWLKLTNININLEIWYNTLVRYLRIQLIWHQLLKK